MAEKILITGAGGYIGRHVAGAFLKVKGAEVVACDFNTAGVDSRAEVLNADIFKEDIYQKAGRPSLCVHLAWSDGFFHNSDNHMRQLSGHYDFLRKMLESGLKHLVVLGTMHEIGYHEGVVDENTPCRPSSMYGVAKDALRKSTLLMAREAGITVQWLRAFYIYGDDKRNQSVFTKLIKAEEEGKSTFPFNTGKNKYDFIHVEELARQIAAAASQEKITGIINCCSGKPVALAEMVEAFIKENNMKIKLEYGAFPDRPYDSPAIWGNNEKIQKILGCKD